RLASSGSVTTGTCGGPSTCGVSTNPEPFTAIGVPHHAASVRSGHTTNSSTGHPNRAYRVATYAGQERRLRPSSRNCTSNTTPSPGASRTDKVTTASARYSVGATLVRSAENTRACPNTGTDNPSGPVSSSAANAGRSRNISTRTSCRYDGMTMTLTAPTD